eukprot:c9492_g1_i1.p1 GENE.c9492_g1_i1~~c9492_g1_i1.p1  ORF type:complete len:371 (+),score=84.87 c9492_g1_i1:1187-2299(+)
MLDRLTLTHAKLLTLQEGIKQIANSPDPVGRVLRRTELAPDLILQQQTTPIGVLLVIFESRPDVLPQVAALAIRACNGLILKGGKEAYHTNTALHKIITHSIHKASNQRVPPSLIGLVQSRQQIDDLLHLHDDIDLVIPRGSKQLVSHIQANTHIPVLGHTDGICHVYIDEFADATKAVNIVLDSKCDYPSACNAAETLLVHRAQTGLLNQLVSQLVTNGVRLYGGPKVRQVFPRMEEPPSLSHEYSALEMTIEIVENLEEAVQHINTHSSSHTDTIVTEDAKNAQRFLQQVDSACVYHNASTRFSDGYRFGLGAEVGISTSRIHARGPVGVDGLLTSKWILQSTHQGGDVVSAFSKGTRKFTHRELSKL